MKRLIDVIGSLILGVASLPILAIVWVAIKIEDQGHFIFCQSRTGMDGEIFTLYKVRSMRDGNVTRVGSFIRKYRIDELPQLLNVLMGDMSLVGPRPEQSQLVEQYLEIPGYHRRHYVKPGLTGLAQVEYQYTSCKNGAKKKLKYDLYYVKHKSVRLDLVILAKTVKVVLSGKGSSV